MSRTSSAQPGSILWKFLISLSRALDLSYNGIMSHHMRVAVITDKISRAMGLSQDITARTVQASLIHDLGVKTWGDRNILQKFEVADPYTHALEGCRILTDGGDRMASRSEWASFHHERPDGQGYPFRMDSSELSLESRIVAVCDVFSALYENRPYRPGLSPEEVKRILVEMAQEGALDREVVDVAVEVLWEVTDLGGASDLGEVSDLVASTSVNGS